MKPKPAESRSSVGSIRRACTSSRIFPRNMKRCARRKTAGPSRKPEWRNSTTSSAPSCRKLKDDGLEDNTIVVFSTDNGTENFTWPDGGQTPFAGGKGTVLEGGFRVPCIARWPGKIPAGKVENGIISGLDWFPTFVAAAGNPNIVDELKRASSSATRPTKYISTATIKPTSSPARGRRIGTRSSISPKARSARSASTTTSTASSISRRLARRHG